MASKYIIHSKYCQSGKTFRFLEMHLTQGAVFTKTELVVVESLLGSGVSLFRLKPEH